MTADTKFQTPPDVCRYMVSMMPKDAITVLEPTAGNGNILQAIYDTRKRLQIDAPDNIFEHLSMNRSRYDCIVMNPPFSDKYAFGVPEHLNVSGMKIGYYLLFECMKRTNHLIALMPWFIIINSDVRLRRLIDYGLKSITALPRNTFPNVRIQTVVIELDKSYKGQTIFKNFKQISYEKS